MNTLAEKYPQDIKRILAKYPPEQKRSAIMPLLFLAQRETGQVSPEAVQEIASMLAVSTTEITSVMGFYTLFHDHPGGRYRLQVCHDLSCALNGAETFLEQLCRHLGIEEGQTTPDGLFTIEAVPCLAACDRGPVFQLQGDGEIVYYEKQTLESVRTLLETLRQRAAGEVTP